MRVAVLWTCLSGYLNACLKELASRERVELFVCHQAPEDEAPFDTCQFSWLTNRMTWRSCDELGSLIARLDAFVPDVMIFGGWHVPAYRKAAREFAGRCWRVMTTDSCWLATLKQRVGIWISPFFLHPIADAIWVPGERQANFARKLGFEQRVILRGVYACDQPALEAVHMGRLSELRPVPRAFLFVGRFVPEKSLETLVKAFRIYRESNPDSWPLVCCGAGPLRSIIEGEDGILVQGFVQPEKMPGVFRSAGCLILPSLFEPWALVVHEAASAGLLVIASEEVGAVPHLVQPGYNGFICGSRDAGALARLMSRVSALSDERLDEMSRASFLLSRQFSPKRWADTVLDSYDALWAYRAEVNSSAPVHQ
jgi:glycosyltransferase involved in cell wall biosynthesis